MPTYQCCYCGEYGRCADCCRWCSCECVIMVTEEEVEANMREFSAVSFIPCKNNYIE
jgi:hypothetical protein